jgi:hypothetical protein
VGAAIGLAWLHQADIGHGEDANRARLPAALSKPDAIHRIYPRLYRNEVARKHGRSWERLRRAARTAWMRSHPCATATLVRRYRLGARTSWQTVLATWSCDGVSAATQSFLSCIADHEGGRVYPDVWFGGSRGWQGGRFAGTDLVVNHFQTRSYHASKVAPELAGRDRVVTRETFEVLTNPVNAARIAVRVGPRAYATAGRCR